MTIPGDERAAGLLPCPFCGAEPRVVDDDSYGQFQVFCVCEMEPCSAGHVANRQKVIDRWNTRSSGWRDIASAPRDGTVIYGWFPAAYQGKGGAFLYIWHREKWVTVPGGWTHGDAPTLWQPLPLPPTNGDTNEG